MNLDFFAVASNLISLFALIAVGFIAVKSGVLHPDATHHFSPLLMKIALPCTIFVSLVTREYNAGFAADGITITLAGIVVFLAMMYIGRGLAYVTGVPDGTKGVWAFISAYSNSGFMGFPIALALFGAEGLALSVMLNISFNATIYTLGVMELIRDNPNHGSEGIDIKSIIFSNINIATVLSLIFYFGRISVPPAVLSPLNYISGITTPLSMMIIGMTLAHSKMSSIFTDVHAWTSTAMRLVVFPVALIGLFRVLPLSENPLVSAVLVLIAAMPGASVTAVLCEMYGGNIDFAARAMFIQNVLCMVTIPLVCSMI
ncbi:MAG: AEC family transporter [Synergistaceae bacterium]|nr:AEC family transporter [Synergistaceae bacterium]